MIVRIGIEKTFMLFARLKSRTPLSGSNSKKHSKYCFFRGMVIVEAELRVLIYETVRYATQGTSCLSWFEVLHCVLEVAASNLNNYIFATKYRWLR